MTELLSDEELEQVLDILSELYPQPETALLHGNPFELLVATILSAQTTDKQVNKITGPLFERFPTPEAFAEASVDEVEQYIKTVGLYHGKARYIIGTSRQLVEDFDGAVPRTREELMSLPGVGRKTANVVLANAFDTPAFAVDTHVFRVANRLGIVSADSVSETEKQLTSRVPRRLWQDAHHWLIFHGRRVCHARNPECESCDLADYCLYFTGQRVSSTDSNGKEKY